MEFVIQRGELVRELQCVAGVVEKRSTLPILANLLLEAQPKGLQVGASDLEVTIRGTAKAEIRQAGGVTLPAGKLQDIARSLPEAEVSFKLLERNQVSITCGRTRYRIAGQPRDEFPKFPEVDLARGVKLPGKALREMIERVQFAITTEDPRYSLHGALFRLEKGQVTLVATDGYRLAFASRKAPVDPPGGELRVIVPRKALGELSKLAEDIADGESIVFEKSGNQIFFAVGSHLLTSSVPEGSFPKYDEVMPTSCDTALVVPTGELLDAVERVSLLTSERMARAVRLNLSSGQLEIATATELGEAQEALPVEYAGEEKSIGFNAAYLKDFLRVVGTPAVRIELDPRKPGDGEEQKRRRAGDKPGQLRPEPTGEMDYRYIVMPRDL